MIVFLDKNYFILVCIFYYEILTCLNELLWWLSKKYLKWWTIDLKKYLLFKFALRYHLKFNCAVTCKTDFPIVYTGRVGEKTVALGRVLWGPPQILCHRASCWGHGTPGCCRQIQGGQRDIGKWLKPSTSVNMEI